MHSVSFSKPGVTMPEDIIIFAMRELIDEIDRAIFDEK
jgi:hypothetical protein